VTDKNNSWQLVDSQDSLDTLTQQVTKADWVAVDTEFMREKTYHPVLCLLQIATPEWAACVDPQADIDLSGFLNALYRPDLTKVFHAAEQDLELFNQLKGSPPPNLFDSQIAAPLLGFPEQAGYGRLVELICGRILDKSQSRTDWSRRPLSGQQLQYAADDVIELVKIYQHLTKELAATGRDEWLTPEWEKLADPERFNRSPDRAWERLKNLDRLSAKSRGAAQQIAIWREKQAKERNLPRNWVLKDPILFDLAKQLPKNWDSLTRLRGLPDRCTFSYRSTESAPAQHQCTGTRFAQRHRKLRLRQAWELGRRLAQPTTWRCIAAFYQRRTVPSCQRGHRANN